jgi:hypothetical protein
MLQTPIYLKKLNRDINAKVATDYVKNLIIKARNYTQEDARHI